LDQAAQVGIDFSLILVSIDFEVAKVAALAAKWYVKIEA
jgi:hypothetical protein